MTYCAHSKYSDGHCAETLCPNYYSRCPRHEDQDTLDEEYVVTSSFNDELLFKVEISNATADETIGNIFSDAYYIAAGRVSPIVVYVNMTGREAEIIMWQNSDYRITRAAADWKI